MHDPKWENTDKMAYIKACDIKAVAQKPYLIDGLVPANSVALISAPSNAGKTAILVHLATALAEGRRAFGVFNVQNPAQRPVLYVNGELTAFDFKRYADAAAKGLGLPEASGRILLPENGNRGDLSLRAGTLEHFDGLSRLMYEVRPSLVVLDTMRALFDVDENDQQEVCTIGKSLTYIAKAHDCSVIMAHHTRKPGQFFSGAQASVSGSGYVVGMVDTHIALHARDGRFASRLEIVKDRRSSEGGRREYTIDGSLVNGVSKLSLNAAPSRSDKDEIVLAKMREQGPLDRNQLDAKNIVKRKVFERLKREGRLRETEPGSRLWTAA